MAGAEPALREVSFVAGAGEMIGLAGPSGAGKSTLVNLICHFYDVTDGQVDEATSSVDTETEKMIQQALDRLVAGRTTFAIAHRLSTLQNADRLIVLENGRIAESGTHDELVNKDGGVYARLHRTQLEVSRQIALT